MSYLRGSPNHIWSTTCILGRGATATVYQGVNKKTGDPVAVKTFNKLSLDRPQNVQMREFDVLRKVNHENIVKLIAIEDDLESASKVLVMELCTGGSLFSILDDPMNSYGLEEDEFLLVLKDLTAGMKHLRDNNIIHRDLKPGNIMKFVAEDGTSIYKLTDFGAARELEEDQQFMSLYGTEEYLHPHMYERAVLRKPGEKLFSSNVDLWSIGVTLYHVATGSLPFRPFGGRRNRDCMHFITTKKESGVISGVQKDHSTSSIEWGTDLPKTCLLSGGLKQLLVPVLAGLMECDSSRMWTFDRFFDEVTRILSCTRLHAFYINECREHCLYIPVDGESSKVTFAGVSEQILKQTQVPLKQQLVIFEKQLLETYLQQNGTPTTTLERPLYIFNIDSKDVRLSTVQNAQGAKFPEFPSSAVNLDEDASIAKTWCSITHVTKRLIERLLRAHQHISQGPKDFALIIEEKAAGLKNQLKFTKQTASALDRQLARSAKCQQQICDLASLVPTHCQELDRLKRLVTQKTPVRTMFDSVSRAEKEIEALEGKVLSPRSLQKQWNDRKYECASIEGCQATAATLVNKIRDNWQALARDKVTKKLNYNDEQFHILEKHKMQQTSLKLMSLMQERCLKPTHRLAQKLQSWYRDTAQIYRQCLQLKVALNSFSDMTTWYTQALKTEEEFDSIVDQFISTIKAFSPLNVPTPPLVNVENFPKFSNKPEMTSKTLLTELEELKRQQNEILQIVEESQEIMQNVLSLSSTTQR